MLQAMRECPALPWAGQAMIDTMREGAALPWAG
jgi:hypothetical protein